MQLATAVDCFITAKRADGRAPRTLADYHRCLDPVVETLGEDTDLATLTIDQVRTYVANLRDRWGPGTVAIHVRNLRAWLNWLYNEHETPTNLASALRVPRASRRIERLPTDEELIAYLATSTDSAFRDLRFRALILTLLDVGLRASEAVELIVSDWNNDHDFNDSLLFVVSPKTDAARFNHLGITATAALRDWMRTRGPAKPTDPLFCDARGQRLEYRAIYSLLRRRAYMAGLNPSLFHPHIFRKLCVSRMLDNGCDPERLRVLMGWTSLAMLQVYADTSSERLAEAHRRASPVDALHRAGKL